MSKNLNVQKCYKDFIFPIIILLNIRIKLKEGKNL